MCNPKTARVLQLALALADAPDSVFEQAWALVFGAKTEWQRLVAGAGISEVVGQVQDHIPIESDPIADGVVELSCPSGMVGRKAFEAALDERTPVGPGSALLHIAVRSGGGFKLVITGHPWVNPEDAGHTYVAVYDQVTGVIYPELIDDLDSSYTFLVR